MPLSASTAFRADPPPPLFARWLGRVSYREGLDLQRRLVRARREGAAPDTLLLLEHPPVITLGRCAKPEHLRLERFEQKERGIEVWAADRGGGVTYHGPGQLVGYPVLALQGRQRDAHGYLRTLEGALVRVAADFGVRAHRCPGLTGVWVRDRKLAAIGVRLSSRWITSHGFALNVSTDLFGFGTIVPCGIGDRGVTSIEAVTGKRVPLHSVAARTARRLAEALGMEERLVAQEENP